MSNVSSLHSLVTYSGKESALSGQRLSTVTFKTDSKTGIKPDSKCVSVPLVQDTFAENILDNWERVSKHIFSYFEDIQDKIIREAVIAEKTQIHSEEIGLFACLDYLEQVKSGGRLSKEIISNWFTDEIEPVLTVVLGEKLGVVNNYPSQQQEKVINNTVNRFKNWIESLSGSRTLLSNEQITQIEKCFVMSKSSSPLRSKLEEKLEKMKEQNSLLSDDLLL